MTTVFFGVLVVCTGAALAAILAVGRKRCPACRAKALSVDSGYSDLKVTAYTCHQCRAEWRNCGKGLITREAFEAGAREPIPTATIHTEPER